MKRPKEALDALRRALAIDPDSARAHCTAALCLLDLGRPEKALTEAGIGASCAPEWDWPRRLRAIAYQRIGKQGLAVEEAKAALELAPENVFGLTTLAESQLRAGQRREALANARRAVGMAPDSSSVLISMSFVALGCWKWKEAESAASRALALQPNSTAAMTNLGNALRHRRRYVLATNLYGSGIRTDPANVPLRGNLNRVALWIGGVMLTVVVWTGVLAGLLASGATSGFGTLIAAVLLIPCAAALFALAVGVRRWFGHLTPSMRRVLHDRESWGATFNDRYLSVGEILGKVFRYAVLPIYVTLAGIFLLLPILHWTGDHAGNSNVATQVVVSPYSNNPGDLTVDEPSKQSDWAHNLFVTGLVFTAVVPVSMVKTRVAQQKRLAAPRIVDSVPVDWP